MPDCVCFYTAKGFEEPFRPQHAHRGGEEALEAQGVQPQKSRRAHAANCIFYRGMGMQRDPGQRSQVVGRMFPSPWVWCLVIVEGFVLEGRGLRGSSLLYVIVRMTSIGLASILCARLAC